MGAGWLCARLKLVQQDVLSRQLNCFAMLISVPAFILQFLGIKTDLRDVVAWRCLGVYMLWGLTIQLACAAWSRFGSIRSLDQLGLNSLILTCNNTGCVGWPLLVATLGPGPSSVALLLDMVINLQFMPFSVTCFEWQIWLDQGTRHVTPSKHKQTCPDMLPGAPAPAAAAKVAATVGPGSLPGLGESRVASPLSICSADGLQAPELPRRLLPTTLKQMDGAGCGSPGVATELPGEGGGKGGSSGARRQVQVWADASSDTCMDTASNADIVSSCPDPPQQVPLRSRRPGPLLRRALSTGDGPCRTPDSATSLLSLPLGPLLPPVLPLEGLQQPEGAVSSLGLVGCGVGRNSSSNTLIMGCPPSYRLADTPAKHGAESSGVEGGTSQVFGPCGGAAAQAGYGVGQKQPQQLGRQSSQERAACVGKGGLAPDRLRRMNTREVQEAGWASGSCFMAFVRDHPQLWQLLSVQAKNQLLWTNVVAIAISLSGLGCWLDPDSPQSIRGLAWVEGSLAWGAATCVPLMLFATGVWAYGKAIINKRSVQQVVVFLLVKLLLLPLVMVGYTWLMGLRDAQGLALVLLTASPCAQLCFVLCQQYNVGPELATGVTVLGVLLMLPHSIMVLQLAKVSELYEFEMRQS